MNKKKILVTGGAGFLGHHLCRKLAAAGHKVRVFDLKKNREFKTFRGDLRDENSAPLKKALKGQEVVMHLAGFIEAGESVEDPRKYAINNILGSFNLLEAVRVEGIKDFVFSSSAAVYGEPKKVPIPEDHPTYPVNNYGSTKVAVEALMSSYSFSYGFTAVALRYFNLYGPGEAHTPESHLIPRFIHLIKEGQPLTIWGDGKHKREYVYVEDIAEAHVSALKLKSGFEAINLSSGRSYSVMKIAKILSRLLDKKPKLKFHPPRPGDPLVLEADTKKAEKLLGWRATTSLEDGLGETIKYFRNKKVVLA